MVPLSMTLSDLWPIFQGYKIFDIEHLRNNTTLNYSYYRTSIGSLMHSMEWWPFQWPWRTPNPVFKVTLFLKSNISKTVRFMVKVTKVTNRKPYPINRMVPLSMTLSDLWPGFVWWSWLTSKRVARVSQHHLLLRNTWIQERRNFLQNVNQMKLGILNTYRKWIVVDWYLVSASTVQQLRNSRSTRYNRWLRSHLVVAQ